jgi:hypothetical protein
MVFLNNCGGRKHATIYKDANAFYDLGTKGFQSTKGRTLQHGDWCIVVSPAADGRVTVTRFSFVREDIKPDEKGELQRVLIGKRVKSESLYKSDAAEHLIYSVFFDTNGNFKRRPVLER